MIESFLLTSVLRVFFKDSKLQKYFIEKLIISIFIALNIYILKKILLFKTSKECSRDTHSYFQKNNNIKTSRLRLCLDILI